MLYDDQPLDLNPALVDGRRGPLSLPLSLSQEARSPTAPAPCGRKMLQRTVICDDLSLSLSLSLSFSLSLSYINIKTHAHTDTRARYLP